VETLNHLFKRLAVLTGGNQLSLPQEPIADSWLNFSPFVEVSQDLK